MTNAGWVLRAEGVNFGDTIVNTNDLSCIRGSSLCLEAIAVELCRFFKDQGQDAELLMHGASIAAFFIPGIDERKALELRDRADAQLRQSYEAPKDRPKPLFFPDHSRSQQAQRKEVELVHEAPTEHMTIMVDVEPVAEGGVSGALRWAQIRSRRRQLRSPNVPRSAPALVQTGSLADKARRQCPIDPLRFTVDEDEDDRATIVVNEDRYPAAERVPDKSVEEQGKLKRIRVCRRVADLRSYGRHARREIYAFQLRQAAGGCPDATKPLSVPALERLEAAGLFETYNFARSFEDLAGPMGRPLPASVQGKLAFLHFDGNGFSKLRNRIGDIPAFSLFVRRVNAHVLENLVLHFIAEDRKEAPGWGKPGLWTTPARLQVLRAGTLAWQDQRLLRMETILFGGEDFVLAVPAAHAFKIAQLVLGLFSEGAAEAMRLLKDDADAGRVTVGDKTVLDELPSWRVGLLICHSRTPVRRALFAAHELCEDAKKAYGTAQRKESLAFHISESHDVPELSYSSDAIGALREGYQEFALDHAFDPGEVFRATGDDLNALLSNVAELTDSLPHSQVYRLIEALISKRSTAQDIAAEDILEQEHRSFEKLLTDFAFRARGVAEADRIVKLLPSSGSAPLMRLVALAELWDYVAPFAERLDREDAA